VLSHDGRDASDRLLPSTLFLKPVPALSDFGLLGHPPVRANGATEGSVVSRRAGPASTGRAATRPGCHRRVPLPGFCPWQKRRGLAPYTTSSLTPRHPPGHASAFAGQLAWWPVGSRSLSPHPVKGVASHDPRCLPPLHSPRSPAEAPPPSLATNGEVVCHELAARERLSAFERQRRKESEVCNLNYDARARPTELLTLSRAGAVARFALRRKVSPPPGEPRRSTPPSGTCLATRRLPLRVVRVSGARWLSLSLRARFAPA